MDEKMISLSDACGGYLFFSSPSEEITKYAKLMAKACGKGLLNHRTGGYISGYSGASGELLALYDEEENSLSRADILKLYINIISRQDKNGVILIEREYYKELFCYAKKSGLEPILFTGGDFLKALWEKGSAAQYLMDRLDGYTGNARMARLECRIAPEL